LGQVNVNPSQMTFVQSSTLLAPPDQTISVTSSGAPLPVTVSSSGASWLSYRVSFTTTPVIVTVSVNASGLETGTYAGSLIITAAGAPNSPVTVAVTLQVSAAPPTSVNPKEFVFHFNPGDPLPPPQTLFVYGPGNSFTASASEKWIKLLGNGQFTPQQVAVIVDPTGLGAGDHAGLITVNHATTPATFQLVPVTLKIATFEPLWTTNGPLTFTHQIGSPPPAAQTLSVSFPIPVLFLATPLASWIQVDPQAGVTPTTLNVSINPGTLEAGTHTGQIQLTSAASSQAGAVGVTVTVTGSANLNVFPSSMSFEVPAGGLMPEPKQATVSSVPVTSFQARVIDGNWLSVTQNANTTPATLTVSIQPAGLAPGVHRGSILITAVGAPTSQLIAVQLTVTPTGALTISPQSLQFEYLDSGVAPVPQVLAVTSAHPVPTAAAASPGWLSVEPGGTATPALYKVVVSPAGLPRGMHSGTVTVAAPGTTLAPIQVPVSVSVFGARPEISAITNGAGAERRFAPGSLLIAYGSDIGPKGPLAATLVPGKKADTLLGGVQMLLNGRPAPLLYVSSTQVNAVVPFELDGQAEMEVAVVHQETRSAPVKVGLLAAAPVVYGVAGGNEAAPGSVLVVYAAGGGVFEPAIETGLVGQGPGPSLRGPVSALLGGEMLEVLYAGPAPGSIAGIMQWNLRIPSQINEGTYPLRLRVGGQESQAGVVVVVKR
jgi:uncharacterized protein (TIGR03437 family)